MFVCRAALERANRGNSEPRRYAVRLRKCQYMENQSVGKAFACGYSFTQTLLRPCSFAS